jgi:hypothetical protein
MVHRCHSRVKILRPLLTQGLLSSEDPTLILCPFTVPFRDLIPCPTHQGCIRTVCSGSSFYFFISANSCRRSACNTSVSVSLSFGGGQLWTINPEDFDAGAIDQRGDTCLGALFDLSADSSIQNNGLNPSWIIGDTFLVRNLDDVSLFSMLMYIISLTHLLFPKISSFFF